MNLITELLVSEKVQGAGKMAQQGKGKPPSLPPRSVLGTDDLEGAKGLPQVVL